MVARSWSMKRSPNRLAAAAAASGVVAAAGSTAAAVAAGAETITAAVGAAVVANRAGNFDERGTIGTLPDRNIGRLRTAVIFKSTNLRIYQCRFLAVPLATTILSGRGASIRPILRPRRCFPTTR